MLFPFGSKKDLKKHKIWHERKKRIMLKRTMLTYLSWALETYGEFIRWKVQCTSLEVYHHMQFTEKYIFLGNLKSVWPAGGN